MATATIVYQGELRTAATHTASGQVILTDAPKDNHGKGEAFSPTDLVCAALGACMLSIMGIAARTHAINMEGTTVTVTKTMSAEPPRRIAKIEILVQMPPMTYTAKEQKILLHAAQGCPVKRSLHPDIEEVVTFVW